MPKIYEVLDNLDAVAEELGFDLEAAGISDDEDLIIFALNYLTANLEDAFEGTKADPQDSFTTGECVEFPYPEN